MSETGEERPGVTGGFVGDPMLAPRYMEVATFMRLPLVRDPAEVDLGLVGVPYDGGVTNRPGARHGPREVRSASTMMRTIHHVTRQNPYTLCRAADLGDVPLPNLFDQEGVIGDIERFYARLMAAGTTPLSIGGDHAITYPILKALGAERPLGLIHIDAHTDLWDTFLNTRYSHGAPFRRAIEAGALDPARMIQIGIRGAQNADEGWRYAEDQGIRVVFIEELNERGIASVLEEARRLVGDEATYLSFDIDALDPVYAPGTGTPEFGGLTPVQAQALLRGLAGLNLVGADVVEVSPPFDHAGLTALAGATIAFEILCLLAPHAGRRKRPG